MTLAERTIPTGEDDLEVQADYMRAVGESLGPLIRANTAQIEAERTLPRELVDAFNEAGVFKTYLPRELGGLELHPTAWLELIEELSYHNGSAGWIAMIQTGGTFVEPEPMRELLAEGPFILSGNFGRSAGKAYRVDGGYRISGRWPFTSGSPHATWLLGRSVLYDENDEIVIHPKDGLPWFIVAIWPAAEAQLYDTWNGLGLRGTGSGDFEVRDLFVPSKHVNELGFSHQTYDRPLFRFTFPLAGHGAHAVGIARRAVDEFIALAAKKAKRGSVRQQRLGRVQLHEVAVARADALIRASRALVREMTTECFESAQHNEHVDYDLRVHMAQALTFAVQSAKEAVRLVFEAAGTSAVYSGHPLEICMRDILTAAQHALVAEAAFDTPGQYLITRDWPDGPEIDIEYSYIQGPHPTRLNRVPFDARK